MKFVRFEMRLDYLLTSHQEGWQINSLHNPAVDAVKPLFSALESSFIYMPVNDDELVAAARVEFARTGISCPAEFFSAPIQYFVNSQLYYIANRAIAGRWPVEREVRYSATSKHTADVRIAVSADKNTDSELMLFREKSLRVNDCYFHGWTRSGEFWLLNERVNKTDEQP